MAFISRYFIEFTIFAFLGWIWESTYCTIKAKKWENRGFLFGPVVPIYGVGAMIIIFICEIIEVMNLPPLTFWQVFIIGFFGSMILEYVTSWALEKIFHAVWWDYSHLPLNINGRVCVFISLGFAAAAVLIVFVLAPPINGFCRMIPVNIQEAISLFLAAVFGSDIMLTVSVLQGFDQKVKAANKDFNENMQGRVDKLYKATDALQRNAVTRVRGFRYSGESQEAVDPMLKQLDEYKKKIKEERQKRERKKKKISHNDKTMSSQIEENKKSEEK